MSILAFAMYKPKPGKEQELNTLLVDHLPTLERLGFKTSTPAFVVQSTDGTIIEIFEWVSEETKRAAHVHPDVKRIWEPMDALCTYPAMKDLPEAQKPFPEFRVYKS